MKYVAFILLSVVLICSAFVLGVVYAPILSMEVTNPNPIVLSNVVFETVKPVEKKVSILAFGDLMLDRAIRKYINAYGVEYPFKNIQPIFADQDIIVANAEGVFSTNQSISFYNNQILRFTFATSTLPYLYQLGFTHLNQANNHSYDFGGDTLRASKKYIAAQGIQPFGDYMNNEPGPVYTTMGSTTIAFVGFNEFSYRNKDAVIQAIASAHQSGAFTIVYPHWGIEYETNFTSSQQATAHAFIDAGADLILGSHPHVVEPIEIYNGKVIFYSLGNFIFDQSFMPEVEEGLAVQIHVGLTSVEYSLQPFSILQGQASLFTNEQTDSFIKKLLDRSNLISVQPIPGGFSIVR